jgi:hypothetical protein
VYANSGGDIPVPDPDWTTEKNEFITMLMRKFGVSRDISVCAQRNVEKKYTYQQFKNLQPTESLDFIQKLIQKCKNDQIDGTTPSGKGLSTLEIVGIVSGSIIILIGLIVLIRLMKKKKNTYSSRTRVDI